MTVTTPNGSKRFEIVKLPDDPRRKRPKSEGVRLDHRSDSLLIVGHSDAAQRPPSCWPGPGPPGAYHAGVLRALHEAGIKIDLVAGRGVGRHRRDVRGDGRRGAALGRQRRLAPAGGAEVLPLAASAAHRRLGAGRRGRHPGLPIALLLVAMAIALAGMLLTFIGLESAGTAANAAYSRWIETLFAPRRVPTYVPRLAVLAALVAGGRGCRRHRACPPSRTAAKRRSGHGLAGRLVGGPLSPATLLDALLRGALEPDSRRRAAGVAAAGRARPPLRRARRGEPRPAGIPRAARRRPRHGRAARPRLRAAGAESPRALLHAVRAASRRHAHGRGVRS